MDPNVIDTKEIEDRPCLTDQERKQMDIATTIGRRVLEEPGFLYPISNLTKSRIRGQLVTATVVQDVLSGMQNKGLGFLQKVKVGKTIPQNIFYKVLPSNDTTEKLKLYGVNGGFYHQQFSLPLSSSCKVNVELNKQHPQYTQIEKMMSPPAVIMEVPEPKYVCSLYSYPPYQ